MSGFYIRVTYCEVYFSFCLVNGIKLATDVKGVENAIVIKITSTYCITHIDIVFMEGDRGKRIQYGIVAVYFCFRIALFYKLIRNKPINDGNRLVIFCIEFIFRRCDFNYFIR